MRAPGIVGESDVLGQVGRFELERRLLCAEAAVRLLGRCPYCKGEGSFREPPDREHQPCIPCKATGLVEAARRALGVSTAT